MEGYFTFYNRVANEFSLILYKKELNSLSETELDELQEEIADVWLANNKKIK
jgi:hypothetical protein